MLEANTDCSASLCGLLAKNVCDEELNTIEKNIVQNVVPKYGDSNYESKSIEFFNKYNNLSSDLKSASILTINRLKNNKTTIIQKYLPNISIQLSKLYPKISFTEISDITENTLNSLQSKLNSRISSFDLKSFTLEAMLNKTKECTSTIILDCSKKIMSIISNADATGLISGAVSVLNDC